MSLCNHVCGVNCRTGGVGVTSSATQNPIRRVEKPLKKLGHEHQFTVPVEWEPQAKLSKEELNIMGHMTKTLDENGDWEPVNSSQARRYYVTKLRCSGCPEEVER